MLRGMDDAVAALRAFNRFYTRFAGVLDAHYMDSDFSLAEARILYEIAREGRRFASEIQGDLGLDPGYVSRILRNFEKNGLIVRTRGEDARSRPIMLTDHGRALFDALDARTREHAAARLEALPKTDRRTLVAALQSARALLGGEGGAAWSLRTFRPGDMGMIAARQTIIYAPYGWGRPMEALQGEITSAFLRNFREGREQCWVAERAGVMAGSVFIVEESAEVARLRLLYVEPWARGLGIGAALVDQCVAFARAAGYRRIILWTHTVLESARRIYAARGFAITDVSVHHDFGKPEQGETWELDLA